MKNENPYCNNNIGIYTYTIVIVLGVKDSKLMFYKKTAV